MHHVSLLDRKAAVPPPRKPPPPLELLDEKRFLSVLHRAVASHARFRKGIGLLRVTMRDLGEEALREALHFECVGAEAVCQRADGTYTILLCSARTEEVNDLAFRIADRTTEIAQAQGLGLVQTVTGGASSGPMEADAEELLHVVEHAFRLVLRHAGAMALPTRGGSA